MRKTRDVGFNWIQNEVWWGVLAGALSLTAVFVVPAFVGAEGDTATSTATTTEEVATTTPPLPEIDEMPKEIMLTVRSDSGIVVHATMPLSGGTATSTLITPTLGGGSVPVDVNSVLSLLVALDATSSAFAISDLTYYTAYGSFFLNCMDVPTKMCGYWQYTVNGVYPAIGADKYILESGDEVYFFFGSPRLVSLSATSTTVTVPITATLTQYDPAAGEYVPTTGFTLGVVQSNPANPYMPIEVMAVETDTMGSAWFTVATSGEYAVGIKEDFYYPTVPLMVHEAPSTSTTTADATTTPTSVSSGGGGLLTSGSGVGAFDVDAAHAFLASKQHMDGSFGAAMYTDWVALALASGESEQSARNKVRTYLLTAVDTLSSVTDYERRAMALMAMGISPYRGTSLDLITSIVAHFDGTQMGETALVNDDIFALLPLSRAGFDEGDVLIQKTVAFVVSKQKANGSWEGSVDLTAAAIQALATFESVAGVHESLANAQAYLRSAQKADGGFGDSFATSWALQAIRALGDSVSAWTIGENSPLTYLTSHQERDGGMESATTDESTRIWATAYAIPAVLGLSWFEIMNPYQKPNSFGTGAVNESGGSKKQESTTTASTTTAAATSTAPVSVATSTESVAEGNSTSTLPMHVGATSSLAFVSSMDADTQPLAVPVLSDTGSDVPSQPTVLASEQTTPPLPNDPQVSEGTEMVEAASATETAQEATALKAVGGILTFSRMVTGIFTLLLVGFVAVLFSRHLRT